MFWLSMSQQFLVSSVLWITYFVFPEISRQGELAGLVGLHQAKGGISDSQNQAVHS